MLPTPNKIYQISQEYITGASSSQTGQKYNIGFKNKLCSVASNPWTVVRSCAKVGGTGGTWTVDSSDLWTSYDEVYIDGSNKPWVVLKQSAIAPNFQVLIYVYGATTWDVYVSESAGFTGGTSTTRPTATDEVQICTNMESGTSGYNDVHQFVWVSTDGEVTFLVSYHGGRTYMYTTIQKPKNPISQWTLPWVVTVMGGSNSTPHYFIADNLSDLTNYTKTTRGRLLYTHEWMNGVMGQNVLTTPDDVNAGVPFNLYPIAVWSDTQGFRGRKAELYDVWWTVGNDESSMPDDLTRQFIVCDNLAFPWDGTEPEFA
jgi:hypothetical protein